VKNKDKGILQRQLHTGMTGRAMLFKVIALVAFIVVINVKDADSRCPVNACQQGPA
jgi:hypothetical protein